MNNKQKTNWWIDIFLLISFLMTFFLEITGLITHQWIGMVSFMVAALHLFLHRKWVKTVSRRLFRKRYGKERLYFAVDAVILLGFCSIIVTGIIMSTWLNLVLPNYDMWQQLHITSSIITLIFVLLKLGLHLRWLEKTTRAVLRSTVPVQAQQVLPETADDTMKRVGRREFLISLGVVSTASIIALASASKSLVGAITLSDANETEVTPTSTTETAISTPQATHTTDAATQPTSTVAPPTQTPTQTETPSNVTAAPLTESGCTVRCQRSCSYPGHCRRYTDANNNGRCDLGECL